MSRLISERSIQQSANRKQSDSCYDALSEHPSFNRLFNLSGRLGLIRDGSGCGERHWRVEVK